MYLVVPCPGLSDSCLLMTQGSPFSFVLFIVKGMTIQYYSLMVNDKGNCYISSGVVEQYVIFFCYVLYLNTIPW